MTGSAVCPRTSWVNRNCWPSATITRLSWVNSDPSKLSLQCAFHMVLMQEGAASLVYQEEMDRAELERSCQSRAVWMQTLLLRMTPRD